MFWRGGTKSIIVYRLALGMGCRVVRGGTQEFDTPMERAFWDALPGPSVLHPKQSLVAGPPRYTADHLIYSDGLSPLTSV